mmetsp:Transcript_8483/g.12094  ORF Transcript_8483/g.12094 Transcript_8483/m.12094 type:complete len:158 (+) Transcript_8483:105-578(+)
MAGESPQRRRRPQDSRADFSVTNRNPYNSIDKVPIILKYYFSFVLFTVAFCIVFSAPKHSFYSNNSLRKAGVAITSSNAEMSNRQNSLHSLRERIESSEILKSIKRASTSNEVYNLPARLSNFANGGGKVGDRLHEVGRGETTVKEILEGVVPDGKT